MSFLAWLSEKWVALKTVVTGKTIAFVGPASSGKTVWVNFIYKAEFSTEYKSTKRPIPIPRPNKKARSIPDELGITLKKTLDVGGTAASHDEWISLIKKSHYVVYMFDCAKSLNSSDYQQYLIQISAHRKLLKEIVAPNTIFGIVATHPDRVDGLEDVVNFDHHSLYEEVFLIKEIKDLATDCGASFKMIARLDRPDAIEAASITLFKEILRVSQ